MEQTPTSCRTTLAAWNITPLRARLFVACGHRMARARLRYDNWRDANLCSVSHRWAACATNGQINTTRFAARNFLRRRETFHGALRLNGGSQSFSAVHRGPCALYMLCGSSALVLAGWRTWLATLRLRKPIAAMPC